MSEDILAEVEAELKPRTVKGAVIYLAAEMRQQSRATMAIESHLRTLNGTVAQNARDIQEIQTKIGEREVAGWPAAQGAVKAKRPDWPQFMPWAITVVGGVMYALGCSLGWW